MDLLDRHSKIALFFSAGKDSLATLQLLKPWWDRLAVVWVNPGAPHPATVAYMERIAARVPNFVQLHGNQPDWIRTHGWPLDVVPVRCTMQGEAAAGAASIRLTSFLACCGANMWEPMQRYIKAEGVTLAIYGQRMAEDLRNRLCDAALQTVDGVTRWHPINSLSESEVWAYLHDCGAEAPPFYAQGATSSVDCWNCTAYLDHSAGYLAYLRQAEPLRWAPVQLVLQAAAQELKKNSQALFDVIGA